MKLKRRILSIGLGLIIGLVLMTMPLQAAQKLINRSTGLQAYVVRTSICDVFIREQGSSAPTPIHQLLERQNIRLLNFSQALRPQSSALSQYYARVNRFYQENCSKSKVRSSSQDRPLQLSSALPLNQNHMIEIPLSVGDVFLSCKPGSANEDVDSIEQPLTPVSRWIDNNCP